jgi:transposase
VIPKGWRGKIFLVRVEFSWSGAVKSLAMKQKTLRFKIEGLDGGIESVHLGKRVEIRVNGLTVMSFDHADITARNIVIASLRKLGLKGKDVAAMCAVSEATVSGIHQRYLQSGFEALIHGGRGGKKPQLVGKHLEKAVALRKEGLTYDEIARKMHVSVATAGRVLQGIPRGEAQKQQPLPGVGAPGPKEPKRPRARSAAAPSSVADEEESPGEPRGPAPAQQPTVQPAPAGDTAQSPSQPCELLPGALLPVGPAWHPSRYAGTLLICAALNLLGLRRALLRANVQRPDNSVYAEVPADRTHAVISMAPRFPRRGAF